jgi:hypothetical protein
MLPFKSLPARDQSKPSTARSAEGKHGFPLRSPFGISRITDMFEANAKAIDSAAMVVFVASADGLRSSICCDELHHAFEHGKLIVQAQNFSRLQGNSSRNSPHDENKTDSARSRLKDEANNQSNDIAIGINTTTAGLKSRESSMSSGRATHTAASMQSQTRAYSVDSEETLMHGSMGVILGNAGGVDFARKDYEVAFWDLAVVALAIKRLVIRTQRGESQDTKDNNFGVSSLIANCSHLTSEFLSTMTSAAAGHTNNASKKRLRQK